MHHSIPLFEIVVLLLFAVLMVSAFRILRLSPALGYLVSGTVIGPFGISLIKDVKTTSGIAEFGIIFLLFLIGLELSFERLKSIRKHVFGLGGAQVLITGALLVAIFMFMGSKAQPAIIIAGGLALSSTAIVLQVISEHGEKSSQVGRLSLAVLILQDLAVIPLLVLATVFADKSSDLTASLIDATFKAVVCLVVISTAGKLLLRPLFKFIASLGNTELFSATTLLVLLGVALLSALAGLSPALGAFLAGLLIAETEFKHQVEADIMPFKGILMGLFFMTVGMSLNVEMLIESFPLIIALTFALMGFKTIVIFLLCRLFKFGFSTAIHIGMLLSQGGEFAFILFSIASENGVIDAGTSQILLVVVTMSMALTPLVAELGKKIAYMIDKKSLAKTNFIIEETIDLQQHVIISGFGRVGHTVAKLLESENIPYVIIDIDSFTVARERKNGAPIYYGDTSRAHVLKSLAIERAKAVIITHSNTRAAIQTIQTIRDISLSLPIVARAVNIEQVIKLEKAGANLAVAEMFEVSLQLGGSLLREIGISEHEISRIIDVFRAEDYALTRSAES
ncbi:MAG: monovalent cation:proton antiporter-2 (CPA2) family protein [Rickettsiales bacterium]